MGTGGAAKQPQADEPSRADPERSDWGSAQALSPITDSLMTRRWILHEGRPTMISTRSGPNAGEFEQRLKGDPL
jgi:hypothetical protein